MEDMEPHEIRVGKFYMVQAGGYPMRIKVIELSPGEKARWLCETTDGSTTRRVVCDLWQFDRESD
jgi:hypothetical protein